MLVARLNNRFVRLVRTQESVQFSEEKNWVLVEHDIHLLEHRRLNRQWYPVASTRFDWVREYLD